MAELIVNHEEKQIAICGGGLVKHYLNLLSLPQFFLQGHLNEQKGWVSGSMLFRQAQFQCDLVRVQV